jgi:hypothetical protein
VNAPVWANRALIIGWSAAVAVIVAADVDLGAIRAVLVIGYLGLVPGTVACRRLLPSVLGRGQVGLLLAVAASVAMTAAMAELLVLLRAWAPERLVVGLAMLAMTQLHAPRLRRPAGAAAGASAAEGDRSDRTVVDRRS